MRNRILVISSPPLLQTERGVKLNESFFIRE